MEKGIVEGKFDRRCTLASFGIIPSGVSHFIKKNGNNLISHQSFTSVMHVYSKLHDIILKTYC